MTRVIRIFTLCCLSLACTLLPAAGEGGRSYLDRLRELEKVVVGVIEESNPAIAFIGGGSGFCISADGYLLTNEHVVQGATGVVEVYLTGGKLYHADVVGHDPQGDLALLKLRDVEDVPHLRLGDSDRLTIGQKVVALGDPFLIGSEELFLRRVPADFQPAASMGIVSAVHRYSDIYTDAIQVDLAVNRGNSGGPLLTLDGEVVGINGKIETRFAFGINTGVGYAIPSNQIKRFLEPLKRAAGGRVQHGTIRGLKVADRANTKVGLPVVRVLAGSPAARAGFKEGDLVLSVGGSPVRTSSRYKGILSTYPHGEEISVRVARGLSVVEIKTVLVAFAGERHKPYLGVRTELPGDEISGSVITRVNPRTPAERAGLKVGDIITAFGGVEVGSPTELTALVLRGYPGDLVIVTVLRDGVTKELSLRLGASPRRPTE